LHFPTGDDGAMLHFPTGDDGAVLHFPTGDDGADGAAPSRPFPRA